MLRKKSDQANSDDDDDVSKYFKDASTQVEERDIVLADAVRTGVAETPHVVSYSQVFGTVSLNSDPQTTFALPSMQEATLVHRTIVETTVRSYNYTVITTSAGINSCVPVHADGTPNVIPSNPRPNSQQMSSSFAPYSTLTSSTGINFSISGHTGGTPNVVLPNNLRSNSPQMSPSVGINSSVPDDISRGPNVFTSNPRSNCPQMCPSVGMNSSVPADITRGPNVFASNPRSNCPQMCPSVGMNSSVPADITRGPNVFASNPRSNCPQMCPSVGMNSSVPADITRGPNVFASNPRSNCPQMCPSVGINSSVPADISRGPNVFRSNPRLNSPQMSPSVGINSSVPADISRGPNVFTSNPRLNSPQMSPSVGINSSVPADISRGPNVFTSNPRLSSPRMSPSVGINSSVPADISRGPNVFTSNPRSNSPQTCSARPLALSLPYSSSLSSRPVFTRNTSPDFRSRATQPNTKPQASQTPQCSLRTSSHPSGHSSEPTRLTNRSAELATKRTVVSSAQENTAGSTFAKFASAVVSGISSEVDGQLSSHPIYTHSSDQSNDSITRTTSTDDSWTKSTTREPGSKLQTSEKFLLDASDNMTPETMSRDVRRDLPSTSATRDATFDVITPCDQIESDGSPSKNTRMEEASTSHAYTQPTARAQHPMQLTKQESARGEPGCDMDTNANPLSRRRASSAPSVGLEFFGRLFKQALLTNNGPGLVNVGLPVKKSAQETGDSTVQTEEVESERIKQVASGKRRRSSVGIGKQKKRRKSVGFMDHQEETDSRLRDKLYQRVWDGTTFKVEEVNNIDFTEVALSRRGSRRDSMGIIENVGGPAHGCRRRSSTAVHNIRRTVVAGNADSPTSTSSDVVEGKSEKRSAERGERSTQTSSYCAEKRLEPSHAQCEPKGESAGSCSGSKSDEEEDDEDERENYDMYS